MGSKQIPIISLFSHPRHYSNLKVLTRHFLYRRRSTCAAAVVSEIDFIRQFRSSRVGFIFYLHYISLKEVDGAGAFIWKARRVHVD